MLLSAGLALVGPAGEAAAGQIFECDMVQKRANGGWLPEKIILDYDAATQSVLVFDPLIKYFVGHPISGAVAVDNAVRRTFTWEIPRTTNKARQFARMKYRLTVQKATNAATMSGQAINYAGPYTTEGTCRITKG